MSVGTFNFSTPVEAPNLPTPTAFGALVISAVLLSSVGITSCSEPKRGGELWTAERTEKPSFEEVVRQLRKQNFDVDVRGTEVFPDGEIHHHQLVIRRGNRFLLNDSSPSRTRLENPNCRTVAEYV